MTIPATEFLAFLKANAEHAVPPKTLDEFRGQFDGLTADLTPPETVQSELIQIGGVEVLQQQLSQDPSKTSIIYCHGGGYVLGSSSTHAALTGHLADRTGASVYSVDYRLAPENPWPAAIEDVCKVYKTLIGSLPPGNQVFLAGDSAGGGLVLAATQAAKRQGMPMPAGLILLSPWCDLSNSGWSHDVLADRDYVCSAPLLSVCAAYYTGGIDPADGAKSALFGDFDGLPPMLIHVGSEEILLSDSTRLAARAGAAGIPIDLKIWPLMPHVFPLFVGHLDEATKAIAQISQWIENHSIS